MLLYKTIKRLDGTDEIDTTKPISKKIGNWVRPLTPSEKKQQKKKQLFNTLNKKEKEILEYIKKKDLSETLCSCCRSEKNQKMKLCQERKKK